MNGNFDAVDTTRGIGNWQIFSQRIVNCRSVGELFGNIRIQAHHIGAFFIPLGVLASHTFTEIVVIAHSY